MLLATALMFAPLHAIAGDPRPLTAHAGAELVAAGEWRPPSAGATIAFLPRWDPSAAGYLIERYGCTHWANVPTMVVDLLHHPDTAGRDLSSLVNVAGGGSSMPEPVAKELQDRCGVQYMEAYGMTETISQTHFNPPTQLRRQCLGIPTFDVESHIVDPDTLSSSPS